MNVVARESGGCSVTDSYSFLYGNLDHAQGWSPVYSVSVCVKDPRNSGKIEGLVEI